MKRKHSPDLLYAFALSLIFAVIDVAVFVLAAEPLGSVLRFTPVWLCNVVHAAATALIGTLLHIKPILHFTTGTLSAYKKARGMNRAQDVMIEAIRAELAGRFAEPLAQGRVTLLAASSASAEATAAWEARLQAEFPGMKLLGDQLSLGVSCHIGEGGMGVGLSVSPE